MSKPETWKSWEGRVIDGKFPLRQYLGGSDHSAVFLTETPAPQSSEAAIKLIDPKTADLDREFARLRAATSLSHPNLVRTSEAGRVQVDGSPVLYVVMECADDNLAQILPQRALEPGEVGELLPPVMDALSYLHSRGFVHSRITPSNVLAVGSQLKLSADNATSAEASNSTRRRADAYDAPETAAGIVTTEGDIWSVGALLVAALTQNVALVEDGSASKTGLPQNIPEPFRGIARECLHLDPKRRCSLAQIRARLQPAARSVPAEPETVPVEPGRDQRYWWRTFVPIAVLILAVLGWGLYHVIFATKPATTAENPVAVSEPPKPETAPPAAAANPAPAQPAAHPPSATAQPDPARVNTPGAVLHQVVPEVPKSAQNTISGTIKVVVHVEVDPAGKVASAKFKSSGRSKYFANQAMNAAQRWEFTPPQVDGQPTPSSWLLQFRFKRTSIQASSERVSR
jgi:TonB family protein